MGQKGKIYALLVGINNYNKVRKLNGCLNDVKAIENYLTLSFDNPIISKLSDENATRTGIVKLFQKELSKANKEDTILFYYSGHGTQESADTTIWKDETDGALECIVCYDADPTNSSDFLLTDKELRYLINKLYDKTKAHIVTIFDCCNSGDNTRNGGLGLASEGEVNIRNITKKGDFFPQREWGNFLFSKDKSAINGDIPEGMHVQFAACESNQSALEVAGQGVFTKTLLKVLKDCGGNISYNSLRSRIRQYLRASYEQTPRMYIPIEAEKKLEEGFLNKPIEAQKLICEATKNNMNGWTLNMGAIHGINNDSKITLNDLENKKTYQAKVRINGIYVDYTLLDLANSPETMFCKAEVDGIMVQKLVFELDNHDALPSEIDSLTTILSQNTGGAFHLGGEHAPSKTLEKDSGSDEKANYTLHFRAGEVYFTLPNDPFRPLIKPIEYIGGENDNKIAEIIRHLSRWHFIKNLENTNSQSNQIKNPLKVELFQIINGQGNILKESDFIEYSQSNGNWKGEIKIAVTNITDTSLYICSAYLDSEFQCFLKFIPNRVKLLESGATIYLGLKNKETINVGLSDVITEYNWLDNREFIKFIISTTEFDPEAMTLPSLAPPVTSIVYKSGENKKGLETNEEDSLELDSWTTQTLNLNFKNPVYNQIKALTLKDLLKNEDMAFYTMNLYCDVALDKFGQPTVWKLKEGIVTPEDEKSLVGDITLWLGNQIETTQRKRRYNNLKKDPKRLRIVAEGDSWFQYPIKLNDVLDQLYKRYAIRSFAEAGDTLKNYLKDKEYLDIIGQEKAEFFLVSGGGNDMVGDEFQYFLRDTPDPNDTTPKRYLNNKFFEELDKLEGLYIQMFKELTDKYKDLKILVHCYDYVIPVDNRTAGSKGKFSWSGKYMIEKGIEPQLEREKLIIFILDEFAKRLKSLEKSEKYKNNVTFIDTRGIVPRNKWFDEIHPIDEGFEMVANRFYETIERLRIKTAV